MAVPEFGLSRRLIPLSVLLYVPSPSLQRPLARFLWRRRHPWTSAWSCRGARSAARCACSTQARAWRASGSCSQLAASCAWPTRHSWSAATMERHAALRCDKPSLYYGVMLRGVSEPLSSRWASMTRRRVHRAGDIGGGGNGEAWMARRATRRRNEVAWHRLPSSGLLCDLSHSFPPSLLPFPCLPPDFSRHRGAGHGGTVLRGAGRAGQRCHRGARRRRAIS